jgi:serine/threonine protein kinase
VHFDVKGANIFLDADGNAKVADYGSATVGTSPTGQQVMDRNTGTTPGYVAPEGGGGAVVDERFDTHALGKVIQVMHANALGAAVYDPALLTGSLQRLSEAMSAKKPR